MAKKATGTGKVSVSYVKLHKEMKALSKRIEKVQKVRPHSAKLKKVKSRLASLLRATDCQQIMVIDL